MLTARLQPLQRRFDFARRTEPGPLDTPGGDWCRRQESVGGLPVLVELWAYDARCGQSLCAAVFEEMLRVERVTSPLRPASELSRIHREAGQRAVALSGEMFGLITRALELSALTRGAFDIRVAADGAPHGGRDGTDPAAAGPAAARPRGLQIDPERRTLRFDDPDLRIDLGALALAHAVDGAARILQRRGVTHAIVSAGGHTRVIGDRRGRPWRVPFADAGVADGAAAWLPLAAGCLSIARERPACPVAMHDLHDAHDAAPLDGRPDPGHLGAPHPRPQAGECAFAVASPGPAAEGRAAALQRSVAVRAADGWVAAALAEAVLRLGAERGLELLQTLPGADAAIVDADGRLVATPGLLDAPASSLRQ